MKKLLLIPLLILTLTGCKQLQRVGDVIFQPNEKVENTFTNMPVKVPQIISSNGILVTNIVEEIKRVPIQVVTVEDYSLNPQIAKGVRLMGDVAPFPWAGAAASALIAALGSAAHFRGKKWKKATGSAIQAADKWRQVVKEIDPPTDAKIKREVISEQRSSGTDTLISPLIKTLLK